MRVREKDNEFVCEIRSLYCAAVGESWTPFLLLPLPSTVPVVESIIKDIRKIFGILDIPYPLYTFHATYQ